MASRVDSIRLTREQDRRYKLSEADVERIRELHSEGVTKSELARRYGVSINTVRCYLSSEERERSLSAMREYNLIHPPRDREKRATYMRELRAYKKKINSEVRDERNT